jgi:Mrp family chromosome partitioning ATPase
MAVMLEAMAPAGVLGAGLQDPYVDGLVPVQVEPYSAPPAGSRAVILVVSPGKEESRARVVANLAAAYGESGQRVIIVSTGDLESGQAAASGVSYDGPVDPDDVRSHLQESSIDNLSMLSLRPFVRNSAQLVSRAESIFDAARQVADVVLIEAPPFLEFHHGEALSHAVDVVLVVGEYGSTTYSEADQTGALLRRIGAPVLGVVFTESPLDKAEKRNRGASTTRPAVPTGAEESDLLEAPQTSSGPSLQDAPDQFPAQE